MDGDDLEGSDVEDGDFVLFVHGVGIDGMDPIPAFDAVEFEFQDEAARLALGEFVACGLADGELFGFGEGAGGAEGVLGAGLEVRPW